MEVLRFEQVSVVRSGRAILDRIDWSVHDDQRWVVLGPNGAGKTTTLALAGSLIHPSSGTVHVLGERLGAVDVFELRPRIGIASAALAEQLPGLELVRDVVLTSAYGIMGRWRESYADPDLARAHAVLSQMGALELATRTYGTLSEGERKRVQIARALMTDPELLLLDEPAAGLDLGGREDLVSRLAALAGDPWSPATVVVTHHVEEVPAAFTHALLLREGRVVAAGTMSEVLTGENLSTTFGMRLRCGHNAGRYWARAVAGAEPARGRRAHAGDAGPSGAASHR
jgi:iron complex transport system ATP-binding protein